PARAVDPVLALADPARPRDLSRAKTPVQPVPAVTALPEDRRHRVGMRRSRFALLSLILFRAALARAGDPPPFTLYGDESVASTDDARALFVTPAAIGWRYPSELLIANAGRGEGSSRTTGSATWKRLALGFLHQAQVEESYQLGFSLGDEHTNLGWV